MRVNCLIIILCLIKHEGPSDFMESDTCPITLDPIDPLHRFRLAGVDFDIFALYGAILHSVNFVHPISRVPLTLENLKDLEAKIQELCGEDAIYTPEEAVSLGTSTADTSDTTDTEDDYEDEPESLSLQLRLLPQLSDERIRLQVDLNVPFNTPQSSEGDPDELLDISESDFSGTDLPPSRRFPSIVHMFNDTQRVNKMKADMDLLQYLNYDSLDVLTQMISLLCDDHFHQLVWEQTSPSVFEAINRLVSTREGGGGDIDVEVTYSDCWETYRTRVVRMLNRRFTEVINDIRRVNPAEAELCVRSHISNVEHNTNIPPERKSWLIGALRDLLP